MKTIAIIPARGGSKRIEHKNTKPFLGTPIIMYPIRVLKSMKMFDKIVVSSDDKEILTIAKNMGVDVMIRSYKNSSDTATTADVIEEVLSNLDEKYDYCCCVYPTSIFVTSEMISTGFDVITKNNFDCVFSCVAYNHPIQQAFKLSRGLFGIFDTHYMYLKSQDLEKYYHDAGQFYWLNLTSFNTQKRIFMSKSKPIELSELEVQDINTPEDWKLAELKWLAMHNNICPYQRVFEEEQYKEKLCRR